LFVGNGLQGNVDAIKECPGCTVHAFVPTKELVSFYRASDVGVWPKQESTSQLDAAACGLPLILSNRVEVKERINGNGVLYEEGNADDLVSKLQSLSSPECRKKMGESGARKMQNSFSWECIAKEYVKDYETSLC